MNRVQPGSIRAPELQSRLQDDRVDPLLVDVREDQELNMAPFPAPVLHLPLSRSDAWLADLDQRLPADRPVVVLCHAGVRSLHFGLWLLEQRPSQEVWNLVGGIDAWSLQVDPSVPRY